MASDTLSVTGRDGTVYGLHTDSGGNWVPDDELDVYDAVNALCDALLAARREWVPVGTRLPEVRVGVFVSDPQRDECDIAYVNEDGNWMQSGCGLLWEPTHWMPLPSPPKEATP